MMQFKQLLSMFSQLKAIRLKQWYAKRASSNEEADLGTIKEACFQTAMSKNPYLQSRALWNDMYGDVEQRYRRARRLNFLLSGSIALAILGFVYVASETKIKPFPFILQGHQVLTPSMVSAPDFGQLKAKLALHFSTQFIRAARAVSIDGEVNAQNKIAAYSFVGGDEAMQVLKDFYQANDANRIAQHVVKNIRDMVVLPSGSSHTLTLRWKEDARDVRSGVLIKSEPYIAQITYHYGRPAQNQVILKTNPLGFYITYLSWSRDQNG